MSDDFICAYCGERHDLITDMGFKLPDAVYRIAPDERPDRIWCSDDICEIDGDRCFIRAVLYLPFTERPDAYGWGVWAEVDRATFDQYVALYDADRHAHPPGVGILANDMPPYPRAVGAAVTIRYQAAGDRPHLILSPDDTGRLAIDQREGISDARYRELTMINVHRKDRAFWESLDDDLHLRGH